MYTHVDSKVHSKKAFAISCNHLIHKKLNKCFYTHTHTFPSSSLVQWTSFTLCIYVYVDQLCCWFCANWKTWERIYAHTRFKHPIFGMSYPHYTCIKARGFHIGTSYSTRRATIPKPVWKIGYLYQWALIGI